jgi:hypothetical protein
MRKRIFLGGIAAITLVFVLLAAGCSDAVSFHSIAKPDVQAKVVTGGVMLSWNPVIEAQGYQVLRGEKDKTAVLLATVSNPTDTDKGGIINYFDVANFQNEIKSNTEYTYTVFSIPIGAKDVGKWEKKITTGTIPAQGSEAAAPTVDLAINFGDKSITVTITPPASGNIPNNYWIQFSKYNSNSITNWIRQDPSTQIVWTLNASQAQYNGTQEQRNLYNMLASPSGEYTLRVNAGISEAEYYKEANFYLRKEVEPLFSGYLYSNYGLIYTTAASVNTATGFYASLDLSNFRTQPGVTYTVERATVDKFNVPGAYASVSLTRQDTSTTPTSYPAVTLDRDVLGNLPATTVYDRGLPLKKETYRYRIKAVKDGITDYRIASDITVDPYDYLSNLYLSVGDKTTAGTNDTFKITPSNINYKGILQNDDKVVLYWIRGNNNAYRNGYTATQSISFSKTEIEAATPAAKDLTVPSSAANNDNLFVQAWLEKADGEKYQISIFGNASYDYYNSDNAGNTVYYLTNY